jgi:hypothetical protein
MQVYRITIQKMNPDGTQGELVEILETERETWTSVFDFVDSYRAEMADIDDMPTTNEDAFLMLEHAIEYLINSDEYWQDAGYLDVERALTTLREAHKAIGPLGQTPSWEQN